jgi:ribosomal protein L2
MSVQSINYNALMQANLTRVFSERDGTRRMAAIADLYTADAVLYEPDAAVTGHAAISQAVETLLSSLPPNVAFTAIGSAIGHHGLGRLCWQAGPSGGPAAVTGTDVARFEGALIQTLHVLIDPYGA